ncbi:MAG: glutamine synthetase III [Verrucomicrobiota bacterium]|nr:glutamine synthetase III [Verrucomicrobiota bacterium]
MNGRMEILRSIGKYLPKGGEKKALREIQHFGSRIFDSLAEEQFLPKKVAQHLAEVRAGQVRFDSSHADAVAEGFRAWATKAGATHYSHWFQPLTHTSAQKHDSFLAWGGHGRAIEQFRGKELLLGEPDASSLPSGGLRVTHQARGYTAWDPSSFPFLWESAEGLTLCIPAVFYSWKGEALDHKIPLLRSEQKIQAALQRLLSFCHIDDGISFSTLGPEQEYFLVDGSLYSLRPDLLLAGRTVFGAKPPKGQELEDHYFAALKERVMAYLRDVEEAAFALGIPLKTRHNEVAPAQHEIAPLFEKSILACDHNLLLMELMRAFAAKHHLACLFHEKPFAKINGSGKHCNWSLGTNRGMNFLNPKEDSLLFLTLLTAILRAVHEHAGLLRASIASAGNDHRLGGSEAPPTILSVFLGDSLEELVRNLAEGKTASSSEARRIDLGLQNLPLYEADSSDRNRTSFFAFTGNKFEFRAVGASAACAFPVAIINSIVADSLELLLDELDPIRERQNLLEASLPILSKHLKHALPILFSGNNYSKEWQEEAASRNLPNIRYSFHSFGELSEKKSIRALEEVFTEHELESRLEILYEQYAKTLQIEVGLMLEMFQTQILPAVQKDIGQRSTSLGKAQQVGVQSSSQLEQVEQMSSLLDQAIRVSRELIHLRDQTQELGWEAKGKVFCELISPKMHELRTSVDTLETLVDDALWPLPKYREMLFL